MNADIVASLLFTDLLMLIANVVTGIPQDKKDSGV